MYANETMKVLLERGSVRAFTEKDVDDELLGQVLETGVRAPSGGNLQPWSIITIREQATKDRLTELCGGQKFISRAPVNLLFCIDMRRLERWADLEVAPFTANKSFRHFWISFQDTIIAAQNICTAADAMGLGSVYVGTVLECFRELKKMFELPQGVFPVVLLSLGWPATPFKVAKKLPQEILIHQEKYREAPDQELLAAFNEKYPIDFPVTEERLQTLERVCRAAHGPNFAEKCLAAVKENGQINIVQRYFGLHYTADKMARGNDEYLSILQEFGFHWFKNFVPEDK